MDQTLLFNLLEKSLKYTPIVHKQINRYADSSTVQKFKIDYSSEELPEDGLIFFVPSLGSLKENYLVIRIPTTYQNQTIFTEINCEIYIETNDGVSRKAGLGDIIAYRMCIFRFVKYSSNVYRAILINSPINNDIRCSNIYSTHAEFGSVPQITTTEGSMTLVSSKEFNELKNRLDRIERRLSFGYEDPEIALENLDVGSVYIKLEE